VLGVLGPSDLYKEMSKDQVVPGGWVLGLATFCSVYSLCSLKYPGRETEWSMQYCPTLSLTSGGKVTMCSLIVIVDLSVLAPGKSSNEKFLSAIANDR